MKRSNILGLSALGLGACVVVGLTISIMGHDYSETSTSCSWTFYPDNISAANPGGAAGEANPFGTPKSWTTQGGYFVDGCLGTIYRVDGAEYVEVTVKEDSEQ